MGEVPSLGPVILFDDMEELLKWTKIGTGADYVVEKSQTEVYNKDYGLHIATRATDPADGDYVKASRSVMSRPGKRYRGECMFWSSLGASVANLSMEFDILDGVDLHEPRVRWDVEAERWFYYSSAGTWVWLSTADCFPSGSNWHRLLLEWDESSAKYIRLVCDAMEIDMSALSYKKTGGVGALYMSVRLYLEAAGAAQVHAYVDDVLVMEI